MRIGISNSSNFENDESQRKTSNIIMVYQWMSSYQTVKQFVEFVEGVNARWTLCRLYSKQYVD